MSHLATFKLTSMFIAGFAESYHSARVGAVSSRVGGLVDCKVFGIYNFSIRKTFRNGNFQEIQDAGGLAYFLEKLHKQFGPVASFWYGKEFHISVGGSRALKDVTPLFNRPLELFKMVIPMLGHHSIQTLNGEDGKRRHKMYTEILSAKSIRRDYKTFNQVPNMLNESNFTS